MLTRNDATVGNALDLIEIARPLGLKHIGFKDVGADAAMLKRLTEVIRLAGASVWMEVVSTAREDELRSVALARDLGVDWLMGGVHAEEGVCILAGSATRYLPFAGRPTAIRPGSAARPRGRGALPRLRAARLRRRRHSRLSRHRGRAARPRRRLPARICRRGHGCGRRSINSAERIAAIRAAGADAFTIGAAAIECAYAPGAGPLEAQLRAVLRDCQAAG